MGKYNLEKCKSSNKGIYTRYNPSVIGKASTAGITLIALIITIIVLLILAGITINALTGSDSAPAKANEAEQKNDIGSAKDQIAVSAINAKTTAYETAYVGNSVSAGNAATTIGQAVIDAVLPFNGTSTGKASIEVTQAETNSVKGDATITITTRDFEVIGTITINDGILTWGEVEPNIPGVFLDKTEATLNPNGTLTLTARKKNVSENITWTITGDSTITKTEDSGDNLKVTIKVAPGASNGDNAIIKASAGGYEATCEITVEKVVVTNVAFSSTPSEIQKGESITLTITTTGAGGKTATPSSVTFEAKEGTSNSTKVYLVQDGTDNKKAVLKGVTAGGPITIKATADGVSAQFNVTVVTRQPIEGVVGDYIPYDVSYKDIYSDNVFTSATGWRILDAEATDTAGEYKNVKIISTGIPAKVYYHYKNDKNNATITADTKPTWWGTDEQVETIFGKTYSEAGFIHKDADSTKNGYPNYYAAAGLFKKFISIPLNGSSSKPNTGYVATTTNNAAAITNTDYNGLTGTTEQKTKTNITTPNGSIFLTNKAEEVHNLTIQELNFARGLDSVVNYSKNPNSRDAVGTAGTGLFYLRNLNAYGYTSDKGVYWLASPNTDSSNTLRRVNYDGFFSDGSGGYGGLRPVVSLKSNIHIKKVDNVWTFITVNQ